MIPLYDRVAAKTREVINTREWDATTFDLIYREWCNGRFKQDGVIVERLEPMALLSYQGTPVFTFDVQNRQIVVTPSSGGEEQYADLEEAYDRMADLLANTYANKRIQDEKSDED